MGRKFKKLYVRIRNNSGKSRQVPLRRSLIRKTTPLRRYTLENNKIIVSFKHRRTLISRGLKK